jgi:hypothetical protein
MIKPERAACKNANYNKYKNLGGIIMGCGCGAVSPVTDVCDRGVLGAITGCGNGFLLLVLLFILLACSGVIEQRFFFIIILAIIAFGGFGRTFGFGI